MRKIFLKRGRYTSHSWPTLGHMPVLGPAIIFGKCYVEIKFHLSGFQEMGWMPGQHWGSARKDKEERWIRVKNQSFFYQRTGALFLTQRKPVSGALFIQILQVPAFVSCSQTLINVYGIHWYCYYGLIRTCFCMFYILLTSSGLFISTKFEIIERTRLIHIVHFSL